MPNWKIASRTKLQTKVKYFVGTLVQLIFYPIPFSLKAHIPQLIPALLEATSEMESKEVSYISTRLANDADVQEMLDSARIAAAKSSPMMECVNHVLQFVDGDTLTLLIPKLIDLIKSSIGLATRGTAAHVVVSLTHQCPLELQAKSLYLTLAR